MRPNEALARKAAVVARRSGFLTIVSLSRTTESVYLYVGRPSRRRGGFETLGTLRISCHRRPGWLRGGWLSRKRETPYFDLRPRLRSYDWERAVRFIARVVRSNETVSQRVRRETKELFVVV